MQMLRNELYIPWFLEDDKWGVEIVDGEFCGTVVQINSVEFSEKNDGSVDLQFTVVKKPEGFDELSTTGDAFNRTMEIIINDVLREAVDTYEQARANDSKESDQQ